MIREWDLDYDDVRVRLNKLESVVSEVNKVDYERASLFFRTPQTRDFLRNVHHPQQDPLPYSL